MKKGKRRWILRLALGLVALYLLLGFVALPLGVKFGLPHFASEKLSGRVEVASVWFNPFSFSLTAKELSLADPEGRPVARVGRLHANVDPVAMLVKGGLRASEFSLAEAVFDLRIEENGTLNLTRAIAPRTPAEEPVPPVPEPGPTEIPAAWLGLLSVRAVTIHLTDLSQPEPFEKTIANLGFVIRDLHTGAEHRNDYLFTAETAADESVRLEGSFGFAPLRAVGTLTGTGIRLTEYGPLLGPSVPLEIRDGVAEFSFAFEVEPFGNPVSARLSESYFRLDQLALRYGGDAPQTLDLTLDRLRLERLEADASLPEGDGDAPAASLSAALALHRLAIRTKNPDEEVAAFEDLEVEGIEVESAPLVARAALVRLRAPEAFLRRLENGELALLQAFPAVPSAPTEALPASPAAAPGEPPVPAEPPPPRDVEIARVVLEAGQVRARDASVAPVAEVAVGPIDLEIAPLSLREGIESVLHLTAIVEGQGDIEIDGRSLLADPKARSEIALQLRDLPLPAFSPYAADALGQPIQQGTLATRFETTVRDHFLDGETTLRVKTLRFGNTVSGYEGPSYPVGLVITVLENPDGEIVLDIPLEGSLDNPDFRPFKVVSDVLGATVQKAITAPLRLATSLPGKVIPGLSLLGSGEDPRDATSSPFEPAQTSLTPDAREVLDALATALTNRPQMAVRLEGSVDPVNERAALAEAALEKRLSEVEGDSRSERLRRLYADTFDPAPQRPPPAEAPAENTVAETKTPAPAPEDSPPDSSGDAAPGFYLGAGSAADSDVDRFYLSAGSPRSLPLRPVAETAPPAPTPAPEVAAETTDAEAAAETADAAPDASPPLSPDDMAARLREHLAIGPEALAELAAARVETVRAYLAETAGIEPEQILTPPQDRPARDGPRVHFHLESRLTSDPNAS